MNRSKSRARRSKLAPSGYVDQTVLTVRQTSEALNLSEACVRSWVAQRRLGIIRLGRAIRVPRQEVDRVLAAGAVPAVVAQ